MTRTTVLAVLTVFCGLTLSINLRAQGDSDVAQQIKQLLFCRSKNSTSTRYPWVNVEFLRELADVDPGADCRTAMEALACN